MYSKILVPVDGSPTSTRGLDEAIQLAKLTHGKLRLLHSVDELSFMLAADGYAGFSGDVWNLLHDAGAQILDRAGARVRAAGIEVETVLSDSMQGRLHDLVAAEALKWPAELIVLGTHGRRGVGRMVMGSDAEQILRSAPVPVLLVREPEGAEDTQASAGADHPAPKA